MSKAATVKKQEIGLVFQDKKGLHEFLTEEMEFYLPVLPYVKIDWLRDIWAGKKKVRYLLYFSLMLHQL